MATKQELHQQASLLAYFLNGITTPDRPMRVGEIAEAPGCPVVPRKLTYFTERVGCERHCSEVKRVLQRAVKLGLIREHRNGWPQSGPIYYSPDPDCYVKVEPKA